MTDALPELPPRPLLACIRALMAACEQQHGRPASVIGIPREFAAELAQERAEERGQGMSLDHMRALVDPQIKDALMALDEMPILAFPMVGQIIAAWTFPLPRFKEVEGFCEHPDYAAAPFSKLMFNYDAEHGTNRTPSLCRRVREACAALTMKEAVLSDMTALPRLAHLAKMDVGQQEPEPESLSADPAIARGQLMEGLDEMDPVIRQALEQQGSYSVEATKPNEQFVQDFRDLTEERFGAVLDLHHGSEPGKVVLTLHKKRLIKDD